MARFCTKPWIEADIDALEEQLAEAVENAGGLSKAGQDPMMVKTTPREDFEDRRAEHHTAFKSVRMQQMTAEEWRAFERTHKETLAAGGPYADAMFDDLISRCADHSRDQRGAGPPAARQDSAIRSSTPWQWSRGRSTSTAESPPPVAPGDPGPQPRRLAQVVHMRRRSTPLQPRAFGCRWSVISSNACSNTCARG